MNLPHFINNFPNKQMNKPEEKLLKIKIYVAKNMTDE
jgi:hypothetical protein